MGNPVGKNIAILGQGGIDIICNDCSYARCKIDYLHWLQSI